MDAAQSANVTIQSGTDTAGRNGVHPHEPAVRAPKPSVARPGWFASGIAHLESGLIVALPVAPVVATYLTVLLYIDPLEQNVWQDITSRLTVILMVPAMLLLVWLMLGLPLVLMRLGSAARANPGSHAQLNNRLLSFESYRDPASARSEVGELASSLSKQLDFVWKSLESKGPKWVLGDGFISLWRQVDQVDSLVSYVLPTYRVWARAQGLLLRLPNPSSTAAGTPDLRGQLTTALQQLTPNESGSPDPSAEKLGRGAIAQVQILIDSSRTDRYSGLLRARNLMLTACTMTSVAVYALYWLGIIGLPVATTAARPILSAALLYTTVGGMVGLFQLLYAESQSDIGVDDYGLSMARIIVAPQIAGVAALVGVVVTSLTTSTLSGTPATAASIATIADALNQIRNPANILVAVAFGLSPGLVFSRFRQSVEQTKRELSRTSAQS